MPLHLSLLVIGFFFEVACIRSLIDLVKTEDKPCLLCVSAAELSAQVEQHVSHSLLRDVFEVLKRHCQHLVVVTRVVTQVDENFPRLKQFVDLC